MSGPIVDWVVSVHTAATLYMTGLIWFVQLVHYPLFAAVGPERFAAYERGHTSRTQWAVGPPMLAEGVTAAALLILRPVGIPLWALGIGFALVVLNSVSTALVQIPCHTRLCGGFDATAHRRLVSTNWVRTAAWTARGVLTVAFIQA